MATTTTTTNTATRSSSASSISSRGSSRPHLRLTTHNLTETTTPKATSPTPRFYAHLLYVDTPQRERIMARSISSGGTSVRSLASTRSHASTHSSNTSQQPPKPPVTPAAHSGLSPISSPTYFDEHYPLISSISPATVPAHIPRTHPAFHCARHMAQIHNLLIRALNAIYNHSLRVGVDPSTASSTSTTETADFLHFCRIWCALLNHHHLIEDTWVFPEFEKLLGAPGAMDVNVAGHDAFLPGLRLFEAYVSRTRPDEYCGMTLRNMLERFAPLLVEHLHEEIPTVLSMWRVEAKPLGKVWARAEKMGRSGGSVWEAPVMVLACVDREMLIDGALCEFPEVPRGVEMVVRKGLARRFAGVWRFAPFDFEGKRRAIPSVGR